MALVSFFNDPFVADMERAMHRLFHPSTAVAVRGGSPATVASLDLHRPSMHTWQNLTMPMDIVETSNAFEVHADTPGMSPDDLKVEFHDGVLTLSGSRKVTKDDKDANGKVWRSERASYSFTRSFALPENATSEGISAAVDKGVLKVTVPKKEPEAKPEPKRIAVTTTAA